MTLENQIIKKIIKKVLKSQDHRIEIVNLINMEFLQFSVDFFKKVVDAKLNSKDITIDWYTQAFLNSSLPKKDIIINSGLNEKTIKNMHHSTSKSIVIDASHEHFAALYENIQMLIKNEQDIDLNLTIKFNGVSVDLNISESLIVINTLAVKRAALRGGLWSTAGKRAEKYLMLTLCKLYNVSESNYDAAHFVKNKSLAVDREIDFYLVNGNKKYKCEVKLMGHGNPESADAIIARKSDVFVADTLSQQNKNQCDELNISWVACQDENGFRRFKNFLEKFDIPFTDYPQNGNLDEDLDKILEELFSCQM